MGYLQRHLWMDQLSNLRIRTGIQSVLACRYHRFRDHALQGAQWPPAVHESKGEEEQQ